MNATDGRRVDVAMIGMRLLQLRELRGLSVSAVAAEARIAKSYVAKLERGEVDNPGVGTLDAMAAALGTTLADLLAPATGSHRRARWSTVVDPLEVERLRATMPASLLRFLEELERDEGGRVPADLVRTLGLLQIRGRRPDTVANWRFVYEAMKRSFD